MKDEDVGCGVVGFFSFFAFLIGCVITLSIDGCIFDRREKKFKMDAVENGVAEWVVVGPDGRTEFRWKKPAQPTQP